MSLSDSGAPPLGVERADDEHGRRTGEAPASKHPRSAASSIRDGAGRSDPGARLDSRVRRPAATTASAALVGDARLFVSSRARISRFFNQARAIDILVPRLQIGGDARLRRWRWSLTMRARSIASRENVISRLFGFGLAQGPLARDLSALQRAAHLDVAFLFEPRSLALALDLAAPSRSAARFRVRILIIKSCSMSLRSLRLGLDVFHQPRQALGVEKRFEGLKNSRSV